MLQQVCLQCCIIVVYLYKRNMYERKITDVCVREWEWWRIGYCFIRVLEQLEVD